MLRPHPEVSAPSLEAKIFLHSNFNRLDQTMYSFSEDFPYDDDPMPGLLADERNLDFPLERAGEFMDSMLQAAVGKRPGWSAPP